MATIGDATTLPWVDEIAASFPVRDFVAFHRSELPELIARHGHLSAAICAARPLAFRVEDGTTFT